jgi:hypothetical protein
MISVLDTKYKSIGRILLMPENQEAFYIHAPIDFLLFEKDKEYYLHLRYTSYTHTFDYQSYKAVVPLEDKHGALVILHMHNYLIPDENCTEKSSTTGYTLYYKIRYNENDENDSLFISYISNKPIPTNKNGD